MRRLVWLVALAWWSAHSPARAVNLGYALYVLGVPAGVATLSLTGEPPSYRVGMRFHTTGIADLFVGDRIEEYSDGRFDNDWPAPTDYGSNGRLHGQDRIADMVWRDGTPVITAITPPNSAEREEVPATLLAGVIDPLDAIVLLLHRVASTGRCDAEARAFDGRRLQSLRAVTIGEETLPSSGRGAFAGPALRCDFTDQTLAGYRLGAGRADDFRVHRGTIWLASPRPDQPRLPVRAAVETRWLGDAMIYLTEFGP